MHFGEDELFYERYRGLGRGVVVDVWRGGVHVEPTTAMTTLAKWDVSFRSAQGVFASTTTKHHFDHERDRLTPVAESTLRWSCVQRRFL